MTAGDRGRGRGVLDSGHEHIAGGETAVGSAARVKVMRLIAVASLVAVFAAGAAAQRRGFSQFRGPDQLPNVTADGGFTFARVRYAEYRGWRADYPMMEQNLATMLREMTTVQTDPSRTNVHAFDDPELNLFPIAYLSEPGYWYPTESEVLGLRQYLARGAFLIVDDFHFADEWAVFETAMKRVLPDARIDRLDISHPIFDTFFHIKTLAVPYPGRLGERGVMGEFYGIHEDNDPTRRLMVVINYNMDIGDYIEWSGEDIYARAATTDAYKFGINYIIYGLTH